MDIEKLLVGLLEFKLPTGEYADFLSSKVNHLLENAWKGSEAEWRRKSFVKELKKTERDLENVKSAICSGFLSGTVKKLLDDTERRKKDIEVKLHKINSKKKKEQKRISSRAIRKYIFNLLDTLELNPVLGKTFLMQFFNELYCTKKNDRWHIALAERPVAKKSG